MNIFKINCCGFANSNYDYLGNLFLALSCRYDPKPKDLPIGILNEDKGTTIRSNC